MSDLKNAILDAKYIDMIELGDFVVRDCGLPDVDSDGNLMPQATEIAAALFRWAADVQAAESRGAKTPAVADQTPAENDQTKNAEDAGSEQSGTPDAADTQDQGQTQPFPPLPEQQGSY